MYSNETFFPLSWRPRDVAWWAHGIGAPAAPSWDLNRTFAFHLYRSNAASALRAAGRAEHLCGTSAVTVLSRAVRQALGPFFADFCQMLGAGGRGRRPR